MAKWYSYLAYLDIVGRAILGKGKIPFRTKSTLGNAAKRNESEIQYCGEERIERSAILLFLEW